jgi:glucose-6-phosphate 1-epimerase
MTVTVGSSLECELTADNTGSEPFAYEDCLHTYFRVGDPSRTELVGMDGVAYIDRIRADSRGVQRGNLVLAGETVNAYMRDSPSCRIVDPVMARVIRIEKTGSGATVVWNPWATAAGKNAEIGEGWKEFLCVETATCLDGRISLLPGTSHTTKVAYSVEKG